MRDKITELLEEIGKDYRDKNLASYRIYQLHDVHAFYRLSPRQKNKVVHIQGYPGMSNENEARVFARLMDYRKMIDLRKSNCSIGNEHKAVIQSFSNFGSGTMIPYDPFILSSMIGENVKELSSSFNPACIFGAPEFTDKLIRPIDKFSFRDYLKTIDLRNSKELRDKSFEIMSHLRAIMTPYSIGSHGEPLRQYYAPVIQAIENAYQKREFVKAFPQALEALDPSRAFLLKAY